MYTNLADAVDHVAGARPWACEACAEKLEAAPNQFAAYDKEGKRFPFDLEDYKESWISGGKAFLGECASQGRRVERSSGHQALGVFASLVYRGTPLCNRCFEETGSSAPLSELDEKQLVLDPAVQEFLKRNLFQSA